MAAAEQGNDIMTLALRSRAAILALSTAMTAIASPAANAAVTVTISQVGANVVATSSGSLNLTGLSFATNFGSQSSGVQGSSAFIYTSDGVSSTGYYGFTGPASFGPGGYVSGIGTGIGAGFGIIGSGTPIVLVRSGYQSGAAIASNGTFANSTIASLGLTPGTYSYTSSNDTITVSIGQSLTPGAVPEPATWAMMIGGFGLAGGTLRRRRQEVRVVLRCA